MAFSFPTSPTVGQTYTSAGRTWTWDGTDWVGSSASTATIAVTAPITNTGTSTAATVGINSSYLSGAAGKNVVINGGFDIWQRGTSFTNPVGLYTADRWTAGRDGSTTFNVSQQTFTPGTAPITGYEGQYFYRMVGTVVGGNPFYVEQRIEDVRTFANQTATLSYWAKADTATTNNVLFVQNFGSGGSAAVVGTIANHAITTSWQRFTATITFPSVAGKTIGPSSFLAVQVIRASTSATIDIWGVQLEAGNVASTFARAGGTLAGELAACQRYYWRVTSPSAAYNQYATGFAVTTTVVAINIAPPVTMRTIPASVEYLNLGVSDGPGLLAVSALTIAGSTALGYQTQATVSGATQFRPYNLLTNNTANSYIGFSAEL